MMQLDANTYAIRQVSFQLRCEFLKQHHCVHSRNFNLITITQLSGLNHFRSRDRFKFSASRFFTNHSRLTRETIVNEAISLFTSHRPPRHILLFIHSHLVSLTSTCVIYASLKIFCNLFFFHQKQIFRLTSRF